MVSSNGGQKKSGDVWHLGADDREGMGEIERARKRKNGTVFLHMVL
jgi:hypothetical protein